MHTNILLLDTATARCSVAIAQDGEIRSSEYLDHQQHASGLTGLIQLCLQKAHLRIQELSAVCVAAGPGSYTGLRIGVATAKAICFAQNIPLLAVDTLQALAAAMRQAEPQALYLPTIDARREDAYCALYDAQLQALLPIDCRTLTQADFLAPFATHRIATAGNAYQKLPSLSNLQTLPQIE